MFNKSFCRIDVFVVYLQIALLKGGCIEMMLLRGTMNYDGRQNQWKVITE